MWKSVWRLFLLVSVLSMLHSCATRKAVTPDVLVTDIDELLASKSRISTVETTFSVVFERGDTKNKGDGALNLSKNGDLSMRIYSLGWLAFELTSRDGVVQSNPPIDRARWAILFTGLRDCLFWWDIKDFLLEEDDHEYVLRSESRSLRIDKRSMLPVSQTITFGDGRQLMITYSDPEYGNGEWYPSRMRMDLFPYTVTITIREISFLTGDQAEIDSHRPHNRAVDRIGLREIPLEERVVAHGIDQPRGPFRVLEDAPDRVF